MVRTSGVAGSRRPFGWRCCFTPAGASRSAGRSAFRPLDPRGHPHARLEISVASRNSAASGTDGMILRRLREVKKYFSTKSQHTINTISTMWISAGPKPGRRARKPGGVGSKKLGSLRSPSFLVPITARLRISEAGAPGGMRCKEYTRFLWVIQVSITAKDVFSQIGTLRNDNRAHYNNGSPLEYLCFPLPHSRGGRFALHQRGGRMVLRFLPPRLSTAGKPALPEEVETTRVTRPA